MTIHQIFAWEQWLIVWRITDGHVWAGAQRTLPDVQMGANTAADWLTGGGVWHTPAPTHLTLNSQVMDIQ